jgi:tetratricopeptide (TPR) repeat protein
MEAVLKIARVLGWEKRYDESIFYYRRYLQKNPRDTTVHMEFADILSWSGHRMEALGELEIVKRQNPALSAAYVAAGDILRWQRNFPEARDNYRKVLKLDPDNAPAQDGLREIDREWTSEPIVRLLNEKVSISDIDFRRTSEGAQGEFHLADGRLDVMPGGKAYQFKQTTGNRDAKEFYVNGGMPIENEWRWWGGAGSMQFNQRKVQLEASLGIEGAISSHTWVRAGYTREDSVFESNNLSALLSGQSLQLDSYDFQFAQTFSEQNQLRGALSAGFLTDGNSRTRASLEGLHQLTDAPFVKVGAAFKALSFAKTSSFYWSPNAYSGPGVLTQLERKWLIFSYKVDLKMFRIIQTSQTELSVQGGLYYQPRHGFFASLTAESGRGAGAAPQGTTNTLYQDTKLNAGYRF